MHVLLASLLVQLWFNPLDVARNAGKGHTVASPQ